MGDTLQPIHRTNMGDSLLAFNSTALQDVPPSINNTPIEDVVAVDIMLALDGILMSDALPACTTTTTGDHAPQPMYGTNMGDTFPAFELSILKDMPPMADAPTAMQSIAITTVTARNALPILNTMIVVEAPPIHDTEMSRRTETNSQHGIHATATEDINAVQLSYQSMPALDDFPTMPLLEQFCLPVNPNLMMEEGEMGRTPLTILYDMGWQHRLTGRIYNSSSGHGFLIGACIGKILLHVTKSCTTCWRQWKKQGLSPEEATKDKSPGILPKIDRGHCAPKLFWFCKVNGSLWGC